MSWVSKMIFSFDLWKAVAAIVCMAFAVVWVYLPHPDVD